MQLSPIAVFLYNRPEHTKNILNSLVKCTNFMTLKSIFIDGPKNKEDEENVKSKRNF